MSNWVRWLPAAIGLALALLYAPLAWMVAASFNAAPHGLQWSGITLGWYREVLQDQHLRQAMGNTLIVAAASTAISTFLGTALAIGLERHPWPRRVKDGAELALEIPVMIPDILFAVGLLLAFRMIAALSDRFELGLTTLIIGHATFQISFVALVVRARLISLAGWLQEAAQDLYASPGYAFRRITLPLMIPAVVSGAIVAFLLSLDDAIISYFVRGTTRTVHTHILTEIKRGISPQLHALSTVFFAVTAGLVVAVERLLPKDDKDKGAVR